MRRQGSKRGLILVISGPSGSGKTTLLKNVILDKPAGRKFAKSISVTTRPRRSGERDGRDYFFVSREEFRRLVKSKKILEWTRYLGYYYGTKKEFLEEKLKAGRHLALCLDLNGARALKRLYPQDTVTVFIEAPSISELRKRIRGRCNKTRQEEINKRIKLAKAELNNFRHYDYTLKNKNLAQAASRLKDIISGEIRRREEPDFDYAG
ncbi:MAG: guanylate kinase [Candidatus Omnitrophota bacterium]